MAELPHLLVEDHLEILDEGECLTLLASAALGRVAVSIAALPAVFPVNFALYDRRIAFRTGPGTKLDAAMRDTIVAFEVDEFDARCECGWSVLAVGRAHEITDHLELIGGNGRVRPWVGGARAHYVAIDIEFLSGRRITCA